MINFYRTYIAEGKAFVVFAVIIAVALRGWPFIDSATALSTTTDNGGYIWSLFFSNSHFNDLGIILGNSVVTLAICLILSYASWHYSLIREKTFLPFAISLLIFSCHPQFLLFSSSHVAALLYMGAICLSVGLYQNARAQWRLFNIAILFGASMLVSIQALPYIALIIIALFYLRIFNLKNILSIILGLLFTLWVGLLTSLPLGKMDSFVSYFGQLGNVTFLHLLDFSVVEWILWALYLLIQVIVIVDFRLNMHKDKIRTRSQINFLFLLSFILFLSYCLLCWDLNFTRYLLLGTFVIPISHYFALTYSKFKIIFFYLLIVMYLCLTFGQSLLF